MTVEVRIATAEEVRVLRRDVLRPGEALRPSDFDLLDATVHVGAFDGDEVIGCGSFYPDPYVDAPRAWRLRGMAVDPGRQGQGIGRLVLERGTEIALAAGAPLIWANGRVSALEFYRRLGWESVGEMFRLGPAQLEHFVIIRRLDDPVGER